MDKDIYQLIDEDAPLPLLTCAFTNPHNMDTKEGTMTPFMYAFYSEKYYIVEHMLRYNASLKKKLGTLVPESSLINTTHVTSNGVSAMLLACRIKGDMMLELLLENNVPMPETGTSPVCHCARLGYLSKLVLFDKYGVNLDKLYGYTIVKLRDHPPDVFEPYHTFTPLTVAYLFGEFDVVKYLLSKGANPHCEVREVEGFQYTLFQYVNLRNKHDETVMFIDNMTTFNTRDHALLNACNRKNASLEVVKKLVSIGGYDVNGYTTCDTTYTPLYYACLFGHDEIVRYLLDCGAKDNLEEVIKQVKYEKSSNVDVLVGYMNSAFSWFKS